MRIVSLLFHDVFVRSPEESGFVSSAADRYKLSEADFDTQLAGLAAVRRDAPVMASDLMAGRTTGRLAFAVTVDDGGVSYYERIANRLEDEGWRGHCFVTTDYIGQPGFLNRRHLRELVARGHVVGSHSASHPSRFSACSRERMIDEWRRSRCILEDVLGIPIAVASLPGGFYSKAVARSASAAGIKLLFTSEPTTSVTVVDDCLVAGRFVIRRAADRRLSAALVQRWPLARYRAWADWNARGVLKPLLGAAYPRVADWAAAAALRTRP